MTAPLLRMVGIAKRFPGVQALQRVDTGARHGRLSERLRG